MTKLPVKNAYSPAALRPIDCDPLPCPFCGSLLKVDRARHTGADHPIIKHCPLSGWFIGATILPRWDKRSPLLAMEVIDDHPRFNMKAQGRPVEVEMVNQVIEYYRSEAEKAKNNV